MHTRAHMQCIIGLMKFLLHVPLLIGYYVLHQLLSIVESLCWNVDLTMDAHLNHPLHRDQPDAQDFPRYLVLLHYTSRLVWRRILRTLSWTFQLHQYICTPEFQLPPEAFRVSDCTFIDTGPTTDYNYN